MLAFTYLGVPMQSIKVADYYNHRPVIFKATMPIETAVERLLQSGQTGGPVVDDLGTIIGFVSEQDCLQHMLTSTYQNEAHTVVGDVMTKEPLCVTPEESVMTLAENMKVDKPKMYPVCDEQGKLLGIITRAHILLALDKHLHCNYTSGHRFV